MASGKQKMECFESDPEGDAYVEPPIRKVGGASDKKEDKGDVVVQTKINPSLAFEAFAGKLYETSGQDFSDSSLRAQVRKVSNRPELEFTPLATSKKHFESPLDRYNRLKHDLQTFQQDLNEIAQQAKKSGKEGTEDPISETARVLSADTSNLEAELNSLASDKEIGPYLQHAYPVRPSLLQQTQLVDRLVLQLKKLQQTSSVESKASTPSTTKPKAEPDGTTPSSVTYELYLPPTSATDGSEQARQQHLVALDRRLALLEQKLGVGIGSTLTSRTSGTASTTTVSSTSTSSSSTLSSFSSSSVVSDTGASTSSSTTSSGLVTGFPDVLSGLATLQSKLDLLDHAKLEALSRRVRGLTEDMELLQQHREALKKASSSTTPSGTSGASGSTTAPHDKIEALWNLMSRWDSAVVVLPQLISRLQSLRYIHEDSAQAASRLQAVESKHATIVDLLQQDQLALKKVSESMESNIKILEKNVLLLQNRINAVNEKLSGQSKSKPK